MGACGGRLGGGGRQRGPGDACGDREAFDERQLKGIAAKTGGTYYSVTDRDSLEKALEEIDKLEKTELEVDTWDRWDEHFSLFLLLGAVLVFIAVSLSMASARRMA
ncbi:MAG: hypothetical protein IJI73_06340 [Kiritimatiellae bacterium]|nr:hypothetical protein [Kiritimatiellia bacterium]